jgi:beta-lactamase regulating signal transducer with metallopeptidase domain
MLIYILKSTACLAILFLFYKLFLENENMHVFKRFYLIGSLFFALVLPTVVFSKLVVVEPQIINETAPSSAMANLSPIPHIPPALEADITDIAPLLWIVYFLGLLFFGLKFLKNLFQIYRRIRRNQKYKNASFIQVLLEEKIAPHTFFKYIFLNKSKFESKEIPQEVLLHEETHAREKHSLDVVFVELLQVIFWVNPFVYFFKKAIKLNHEFLADRAVLKKDVDTVTYQNTLLSFLSSESAKRYRPMLPNAINYSSIKKRFTVMRSKTSKKSVFIRSILLLPLLTFLIVGFSETRVVTRDVLVDIQIQEGATKDQLAEYNALAENYNTMMQQNDIRIEKADVERLEYLYGLMSEEQRANAEPFPDFPEPPPPPEAPKAPEVEIIEIEQELERQQLASEKERIEMEKELETMEVGSEELERQAEVLEEQEIEMEKHAKAMETERVEMEHQVRKIKSPLPPRPPKSPLEHLEEMAEKDAVFYHEGKKVSAEEAIEVLKKNNQINIETKHTDKKSPEVRLSTDPIIIEN